MRMLIYLLHLQGFQTWVVSIDTITLYYTAIFEQKKDHDERDNVIDH